MALSKDEILEAIAEMSVMEVVELIEAMEEKFGVTAAAAVAAAVASLNIVISLLISAHHVGNPPSMGRKSVSRPPISA